LDSDLPTLTDSLEDDDAHVDQPLSGVVLVLIDSHVLEERRGHRVGNVPDLSACDPAPNVQQHSPPLQLEAEKAKDQEEQDRGV
jgi:hypothetical protein